jgi:hypothetical protein
MESQEEQIRDFLAQLPNKYNILEAQIDLNLQQEYFKSSAIVKKTPMKENTLLSVARIELWDPAGRLMQKKVLLKLLAQQASVESYRMIEDFMALDYLEPELRNWTTLSLFECRGLLEGNLLGEDVAFISSGLGGKNDKLRYFFAVLSSDNKPFTNTESEVIFDAFASVAKKMDVAIESRECSLVHGYAKFVALVPLKVPLNDFIEYGIEKANKMSDDFIEPHYLATNVEIPDEKRLLEIIKKVKSGN